MSDKLRLLAAVVLLSPISSYSEDWSTEQLELLEWEKQCISADNAQDFIGCFHEDFVGWGMGYPVPTNKSDREATAENGFENFPSELVYFHPLSVEIYGNVAVINYLDSRRTTNNHTGEVNYETTQWTDVAIKEDGNWYWIADHGTAQDIE